MKQCQYSLQYCLKKSFKPNSTPHNGDMLRLESTVQLYNSVLVDTSMSHCPRLSPQNAIYCLPSCNPFAQFKNHVWQSVCGFPPQYYIFILTPWHIYYLTFYIFILTLYILTDFSEFWNDCTLERQVGGLFIDLFWFNSVKAEICVIIQPVAVIVKPCLIYSHRVGMSTWSGGGSGGWCNYLLCFTFPLCNKSTFSRQLHLAVKIPLHEHPTTEVTSTVCCRRSENESIFKIHKLK